MTKRPTSFDIAELAGVSQPTVSRALRGSPSVNEQTRLRIEEIARQLHYTVDKNASGLRRQASNTLALLFFEDPTPDDTLINPFFLAMLGSITRAAARAGYDLLTSFQQMSANWHVDYEDSRKADGLILLGYGDYETYRPVLDQLEVQGTHFIRWGAVRPGQPGATIGCDNIDGGVRAGQHLIGLGRRRIAFLGEASSHCPELEDRYRGLCQAMREAGIDADPALKADAITTEASGQAAMASLLDAGIRFDAVFAASDLMAIGAMRELARRGLRVPDDIAIVGFDDIPAASLTTPPLTTVAQDVKGAGEALVDALLRQIRGEQVDSYTLPARLIVRAS
jgi:DNA-binding LacI/PurR family transcriptional regulator